MRSNFTPLAVAQRARVVLATAGDARSLLIEIEALVAETPVGEAPSAVLLHAGLREGMRLMEVIKLTRSLGRRVRDDPETFAWRDESGAEVQIEFVDGRCRSWRLARSDNA